MITQLSFLPDNDQEPVVKRASAPLVKLIDGRYLWKCIGSDDYEPQPELEQILLAAQAKRKRKAA